MNYVRYGLAWFLFVGLPPAILYWFAIHPFAATWRRIGPGAGLAAGLATLFASAVPLAILAPRFLTTDYGFSWPLALVGLALEAGAIAIQRARRKYLTMRVLMGIPELARDPAESRLFSEGIYGRIRHPRYVEIVLAILGYALIANYRTGYGVVAVSVLGIWIVVEMEERELHQRFGKAWEDYAARTPRFVPRRRR